MRRARASLFPDHHAEGRDDRVRRMWCLDYPLPMPADDRLVECPVCRGAAVVKAWRFHARATGSASPYRCDVRTKCVDCSLVLDYGVAVPEHMYRAAAKTAGVGVGRWVEWRQGRTALVDAGYLGVSHPTRT